MKRPENNQIAIDDVVVYTIITPERLRLAASDCNVFPEKTRWVKAEKLFHGGVNCRVVFADARTCQELLAWGVLKQVKVTKTGTKFTVSRLLRFAALAAA